MNQPHEKPGCGNRGKTNCVFPPFPQPLHLTIYTKHLTLPLLAVQVSLQSLNVNLQNHPANLLKSLASPIKPQVRLRNRLDSYPAAWLTPGFQAEDPESGVIIGR